MRRSSKAWMVSAVLVVAVLVVALVLGTSPSPAESAPAVEPVAGEVQTEAPDIRLVAGADLVGDDVLEHLASCANGDALRLSGEAPHEIAAEVSRSRFASAETVYIAPTDGSTPQVAEFSASTIGSAPVLLAGTNELPAATIAELTRLRPSEIIVTGDTSRIGSAVESALAAHAPQVQRLVSTDLEGATGEVGSTSAPEPILVAAENATLDAMVIVAAGGRPSQEILVVSENGVPAATAAAIGRITGGPCEPMESEPVCESGWIALTYDDGPKPERTFAVLAALAAVDVKATFFTVGFMAERHPDMLTRIAEAGHAIANHSNGHEILRDLSDSAIADTIDQADAAIRAAGVEPLRLVRPPGGVTDARVKLAIEAAGYREILWTTGPLDYDGKSAAAIAQDVIANSEDGAVVVLHDNSGNYLATMEATGIIVPTLEERGYCFGVLDGSGNVVP